MDIRDGETKDGRAQAQDALCSQHEQSRQRIEQHEHCCCGDDENSGNATVVGERQRKGRKAGDGEPGCQNVGGARPLPIAADLATKKRRYRDVMRASKRPQGKSDRGQKAVKKRERKITRMQHRFNW
jgi:hypothetical protein